MTRPPILPGMRTVDPFMRAIDPSGDPWRHVAPTEARASVAPTHSIGRTPDYTDPATCGALLAWCHRELAALIAATPKPLRPRFNVARVALSEAKPWDGDSVRRAVEATCAALDGAKGDG